MIDQDVGLSNHKPPPSNLTPAHAVFPFFIGEISTGTYWFVGCTVDEAYRQSFDPELSLPIYTGAFHSSPPWDLSFANECNLGGLFFAMISYWLDPIVFFPPFMGTSLTTGGAVTNHNIHVQGRDDNNFLLNEWYSTEFGTSTFYTTNPWELILYILRNVSSGTAYWAIGGNQGMYATVSTCWSIFPTTGDWTSYMLGAPVTCKHTTSGIIDATAYSALGSDQFFVDLCKLNLA